MWEDLTKIATLIYEPVPRENPDSIFKIVKDKRAHPAYQSIFAYLRGDFEQSARCYQQAEGDDVTKLCACKTAISAAVSLNDYPIFTKIELWLKSIIQANNCGQAKVFAELALNNAYLGALAPNMVPDWLKKGDFSSLPLYTIPFAAYQRAKYFQSILSFESMLATAETALAFCDSEKGITITNIYLRLLCAVACFKLNRTDEAKLHLHSAMRICFPLGFVTPFAESISIFCGLLEQLIKQEYPEYYDKVIAQWKSSTTNWFAFHNKFTRDNITLILSLREYEMALLAARGMRSSEIAKQLQISVGRVNNKLQEIYQKLFVSGKKELANIIL